AACDAARVQAEVLTRGLSAYELAVLGEALVVIFHGVLPGGGRNRLVARGHWTQPRYRTFGRLVSGRIRAGCAGRGAAPRGRRRPRAPPMRGRTRRRGPRRSGAAAGPG